MIRFFPLLALFAVPQAGAFCGTFVGTAEAPTNSAGEVAIVRDGTHTTLTVSNDIHGDTTDFAMVVPVPEILGADAIHTLDLGVFDRLRAYSAPREVAYTCADFEGDTDTDTDTDSDTDADSDTDTDSGVDVVAEYVVGEYHVQILSAEESDGLVTWLQTNGYAVPDGAVDLLGEYIAAGSYFFAAQVSPDAGIHDGDQLSPLQFSYDSDVYSLPIRIGTLNSPGEQDLVVYAINTYDEGAVEVANYPEATVESDCMLPDGEDLDTHVSDALDAAFAEDDRASWVTEYAWGNGGCDPCDGAGLAEQDLVNVGFDPDYHYGYNYYFTRLHLRYSPQEADQDLVLYKSNMTGTSQMRYIQYNHQMEDRFPICGTGFPDDPGSCDEDEGGGGDDTGVSVDDTGDPATGDGPGEVTCGGCSSGGSAGGALAPLLAALVLRRRRRG
jgi:hypothetical protein